MAKILIVDDNPDLCTPLAKLLNHLGHKGICVNSGEDALNYLESCSPDLVILDVMMPGMDGMEVLRRVRENPQTARLPVIMFSAVHDPAFQAHARAKGATDYWVKAAVDFSTIDEMLRRHLN
jgi:CheY-like chemotaxis protein